MSTNIPNYIKVYDLDQSDLLDVLAGGDINENIDSTGNHIIDASKDDISNSLIKITQSRMEFDDGKIEQNYNTMFTEFTNNIPSTGLDLLIEDDIQSVSDNQLQREAVLETQIDELSKILEQESHQNTKVKEDAEQTYNAMRALIIEQRIKNNEGSSESDFTGAFPFLAKESSSTPNTAYDPAPFAAKPT